MRGRPAGSRNKAKAETPIIETPQPVSQSMVSQLDPMYTALMKRLDAMDGMLAQRETELQKRKREGTTKTKKYPSESGNGYITGARFVTNKWYLW